jgi:hypothetical protein
MHDDEFDQFLEQANEELKVKQAALSEQYGLGHLERFFVDYVGCELTFFDEDALRARATILPVATHVEAKGSLKWFWANEQLPEAVRAEAARVKGLYDLTGFEMFAKPMIECDAAMAWEITAMACKMLGALGAYRVPNGAIKGYVLITRIEAVPASA